MSINNRSINVTGIFVTTKKRIGIKKSPKVELETVFNTKTIGQLEKTP